jgi:hypothetical protein
MLVLYYAIAILETPSIFGHCPCRVINLIMALEEKKTKKFARIYSTYTFTGSFCLSGASSCAKCCCLISIRDKLADKIYSTRFLAARNLCREFFILFLLHSRGPITFECSSSGKKIYFFLRCGSLSSIQSQRASGISPTDVLWRVIPRMSGGFCYIFAIPARLHNVVKQILVNSDRN